MTEAQQAEQQTADQFYKRAAALAHFMSGTLLVMDASPYLVAISSSQMVAKALDDLALHNRELADGVTEELAVGLINFVSNADTLENLATHLVSRIDAMKQEIKQ